jgi:hypothetical protein
MLRAAGLVLDGAAPNASPIWPLLCAAVLVLGALFGHATAADASDRIEVRSAELTPALGGPAVGRHPAGDHRAAGRRRAD